MPRILVVDDEPDVLEFQKAFLSRRKHEVQTAATFKEAIEAVKNFLPDIIFCDVRLDSDTTGLDILQQAKSLKPDVIFYLITGLVDKEVEEKGQALGAREVLSKPISNEKLEEKIKQAVPN